MSHGILDALRDRLLLGGPCDHHAQAPRREPVADFCKVQRVPAASGVGRPRIDYSDRLLVSDEAPGFRDVIFLDGDCRPVARGLCAYE
jgi:hypothetical protein